jgi:hypothetical protein
MGKIASIGDRYRTKATRAEDILGPPVFPQTYIATAPAPAPPPESPPIDLRLLQQREPRPMSLDEALQIGMSNSDVVRVLSNGSVSAAATTRYDPQFAAANASVALAAFDAYWSTNLFYNRINQPVGELFGPGIPEQTRYNSAGLTGGVFKP